MNPVLFVCCWHEGHIATAFAELYVAWDSEWTSAPYRLAEIRLSRGAAGRRPVPVCAPLPAPRAQPFPGPDPPLPVSGVICGLSQGLIHLS